MYDWKLLGDFDTEQDFKYFRSHYVTSFGERRSHRAKKFFLRDLTLFLSDFRIKKNF